MLITAVVGVVVNIAAVAGLVVLLTGFVRADAIATLGDLEVLLRSGYSIDHATLQVVHEQAAGGCGGTPAVEDCAEPHGCCDT